MADRARAVRRLVVLIADDNGDTREMYAVHLTALGYKVETARDGVEAVNQARSKHPDVIVLDLQMPGVDGWRAMKDLAGDPNTRNIPIIVLTGHDLKDYLKTAALAVGATSYLRKPSLPEELAREVNERLSSSKRRSATAS